MTPRLRGRAWTGGTGRGGSIGRGPPAGWSSCRAHDAAGCFGSASPLLRSRASSRTSQRAGTAGAPSRRLGQDRIARGAEQASMVKSCAMTPTRSSGAGRPQAIRMGRLIHGPGSASGGQTPSANPPRTTVSKLCSRASSSPRISTRGCSVPPSRPRSARRPRTTAPSMLASSRPGSVETGWRGSTGSAARSAARCSASALPSSPAQRADSRRSAPSCSGVAAHASAASSNASSAVAGVASSRAAMSRAGARHRPNVSSSRSTRSRTRSSPPATANASRSPANPGGGAGPRRHRRSRSRAACRHSPGAIPSAVNGCLSRLRSATGASDAATARASSRRKAPEGVSPRASPALSSATTP